MNLYMYIFDNLIFDEEKDNLYHETVVTEQVGKTFFDSFITIIKDFVSKNSIGLEKFELGYYKKMLIDDEDYIDLKPKRDEKIVNCWTNSGSWGEFYAFKIDFSSINEPGRFTLINDSEGVDWRPIDQFYCNNIAEVPLRWIEYTLENDIAPIKKLDPAIKNVFIDSMASGNYSIGKEKNYEHLYKLYFHDKELAEKINIRFFKTDNEYSEDDDVYNYPYDRNKSKREKVKKQRTINKEINEKNRKKYLSQMHANHLSLKDTNTTFAIILIVDSDEIYIETEAENINKLIFDFIQKNQFPDVINMIKESFRDDIENESKAMVRINEVNNIWYGFIEFDDKNNIYRDIYCIKIDTTPVEAPGSYSIIFNYCHGTYIEQYVCKNINEALRRWIEYLDSAGKYIIALLGDKTLAELKSQLLEDNLKIELSNNCKYIYQKEFRLNNGKFVGKLKIIKTDDIISEKDDFDNDSLMKILS